MTIRGKVIAIQTPAAFPCGDYEIANRLDLPIQPD
jgi:hypothetical protein